MIQVNNGIQMREWQKQAISSWIQNQHRGIISVATGGGKTIFAMFCISHLFNKSLIDYCIIVVPTITLRDQWYVNLLNSTNIEQDLISTKIKIGCKILILTNLTAQKIIDKIENPKILVVYDECHRYGTKNNLSIFNNTSYTLGLTATIERKYDSGVSEILIPKIGKVIFDYDIRKAISDGVVMNYRLINIQTHFNSEELEIYQKLTRKIISTNNILKKEQNQPDLHKKLELLLFKRKKLINETQQRDLVACKLIIENINKKKIIFCETINQCISIQKLCNNHGLETLIYHSKMSQKSRISTLHSFYNNISHTLIGCKALDEGFDVPDIEMGIIVSQTKTNRQRIQRLGRTIRICDGKQTPDVYTLYTTQDEENELILEESKNKNLSVMWLGISNE
jgi:superfamily II DNA or RNA helicase